MNRRGFLKGMTAAIAAACIPRIEKPKSPPLVTIDTETQKALPCVYNVSWGASMITVSTVWLDEGGKEHTQSTEWSWEPKDEYIQQLEEFLEG